MKKRVNQWLCALSALVLVFGFTACHQASDPLVGKWECVADVTGAYNEVLGASMGVTIEEFTVRLTFEFSEDGTMCMALDEAHIKDQIPMMADAIMDSLVAQTGKTREELYTAAGTTREQFIAQTEQSMLSSMGETTVTSRYEREENQLWLLDEGEARNDIDLLYITFEEGTVKLSPSDPSAIPASLDGLLPLTLTRI